MGQKSQIYVRHNDTVIVANYYGWNYGERMVSRARHGMEYVKGYLDEGFVSALFSPSGIEKLGRIFDTNFDMKDVALSQNIAQEWEENPDNVNPLPDYVFLMQSNNDGKLLVDIQTKETRSDIDFGTLLAGYSIKYAFLDQDCNLDNIMDAEKYMEWDIEKNWTKPTEYFSQEDIDICRKNIEAIAGFTQVMSREEVEAFLGTEKFRLPNGDIVRVEKPLEERLVDVYERAGSLGVCEDLSKDFATEVLL